MAATLLIPAQEVANREFDYIVVGGGTAGLVVASRLSEDPSVSVLVLEAGHANLDEPSITMSGTFGKNFFQPDFEWGFLTVPQEHSGNIPFYWPRGKGLGGSSGINFYVFTQPPASDIDAIEKLGNPGWNFDTYLKYSRKSERFTPPSAHEAAAERLYFDPAHHGTDGPISTTYPLLRSGWDTIYQDTLGNLGLPPLKDAVRGDGNGAWMATCSVNPKTSRRSYSVEYLNKAGGRRNLRVAVDAPVARILFHDGKGEAVASGVEYIHDGKTYSVRAKREVILSAGALKSPQILELSGVGAPDVLKNIGVAPRVVLPAVGENVQDHVFAALGFELKDPEKWNTLDPITDEAVLKEQLELYAHQQGLFRLSFTGVGTGSLTRLSPTVGPALTAAQLARVPALQAAGGPERAEQYALQAEKLRADVASLEIVSMPTFLSRPNPPEPGKKYMTLVSIANHPWSRGTIHATSADPLAVPAMDPHYYEEDFDLQSMLELVKFVRRLGKTAPLADIIAREHNPGPEVQGDEALLAWIKAQTNSIAHTSGTCSMLPRDKGGVVDPQLKVYGTRNVRVVDLSVLPLQIGAPTQTYVYALAEQAADIIKGVI